MQFKSGIYKTINSKAIEVLLVGEIEKAKDLSADKCTER
jgi:hypothetical protein